jgi:serine/threonine-protein kinase HipA
VIKYCPGTLAAGHATYSRACLKRMFNGRSVSHVLPYDAATDQEETRQLFFESQVRISISGVQEKHSMLLEKNKLRLIRANEHGTYLLKPIPIVAKNADQVPANEHLTMQIARQVFGIETAENALIFFQNGAPAYLTKRFDVQDDDSKLAQEDFASLAGRTPQIQGEQYKYLGNYLELFQIMQMHLPAYKLEAPKLFKLLIFNYLFSNGDAHFKNFALIETTDGDFRLSPAYDLLNTRIHIEDSDFALTDGLLPKQMAIGNINAQFRQLGITAEMSEQQITKTLKLMCTGSEQVATLIDASFLNERTKRNYLQAYQTRLNRLNKY